MNLNSRARIIVLALVIILINIGCDQVTKEYARQNFKGQGTIEVVSNYFIIHYTENDGAFLSLGSNLPQPYKTIILTYIPALFLFGFSIYILFYHQMSLPQLICIACMLGGGFSNLIDRIIYDGFVTDFLNFGIGSLRTGILNFADMSITFGVLFLILLHYIKTETKNY